MAMEAKAGVENDRGPVIEAAKFYIDKMLSDTGGMKVLLLDPDTTGTISMIYTQTQILAKEVYLVEQIGSKHARMTHLKALLFVRPTFENIRTIGRELSDPKYGEYFICTFFFFFCTF